jgi:hypothetical protein
MPAYAVPDRTAAWGADWITNAFPEAMPVIEWAARRLGLEIVTGPAHDAHGEPCPELVEVRAVGVEWTAQLDDAFWTLFRDGGGSGAAPWERSDREKSQAAPKAYRVDHF